MKLKEQSIVVTGASSGMGKSIVECFAREGANVVAVARRKERLDQLADSLKDAPGQVLAWCGDVSRQEDCEGMIDFAVQSFGKLDVLVNNAGILDDMAPIGEAENSMIERVFQINVYGPMYAMRKAVNVFQKQGRGGNIINITSIGAEHVAAGAVYCASKAALASLTRTAAYMYIPDGIRCNAIAPGGIETEIGSSVERFNRSAYPQIQKIMAANPGKGKGEDIAAAALFLASEESGFVNGDTIHVDGGWNAG